MSHFHQPWTVTIDSSPASIRQVRIDLEAYAAEVGLDEPACQELGLCVNEALANVIRHAYEGATDQPIRLTVTPHEGDLKIEIRDWGNGVDPSNITREHDPDDPQIGGLGLICLRCMTEELQYEPQNPGIRMTFIKRNRYPAPGR